MKILFISQFFNPEIAACSSRVHGLAREWRKLGNDVTVLTFFPHYPHGKPYPEFDYGNRLFKNEDYEGIRVLRAFNLFYRPKQLIKRALDMPISMLSSTIYGLVNRDEYDIVIATSPQPFLFVTAFIIGKSLRIPVVLDIRDQWPDSMGMNTRGLKGRFLSFLSSSLLVVLIKAAYRYADLVVGASPAYRKIFKNYGVTEEKTAIVENGLDEELLLPEAEPSWRLKPEFNGKLLVSFVGTLGRNMGLDLLVEGARLLSDEDVSFLIVGHGASRKELMDRTREYGLKNVHFIDPVGRTEVASVYSSSDLSVVCLGSHNFHYPRVPAKIWEIMGMGIPLLLCTPDGAAKEIVIDKAKAGFWIEPGNSDELVKAILQIKEQPSLGQSLGMNGRNFVLSGYTRKELAKRYLAELRRIRG